MGSKVGALEPDETVWLGLSHPVNAQLGQPAAAVLTIRDVPPVLDGHKLYWPLLMR